MAIVTPTVKDLSGDGSVQLITWNLTTADHTGASIKSALYSDKTVVFQGAAAWGSATAAVEGGNDNSVFLALTDPQGNAISKTADGVEKIEENTAYLQPRLTTPGTAAAVTVSIVARRPTPMRT